MYASGAGYIDPSFNDSAPKSASEVKQPQVHEAIHGLEQVIEGHLKMAAEMEQRLSPIIRNEPQAAGNDPKEAGSGVPVASRINEATIRLRRVLDSYQSVLRRIEV